MFFRERQFGEQELKTGFAFLPVTAKNGTVWLERYELFRHWDKQHCQWINEEILTTDLTSCKREARMEVWVFMWQDMIGSPPVDNSIELKGIYSSKELAYSKAEVYAKVNSGHWFVKPIKIDV